MNYQIYLKTDMSVDVIDPNIHGIPTNAMAELNGPINKVYTPSMRRAISRPVSSNRLIGPRIYEYPGRDLRIIDVTKGDYLPPGYLKASIDLRLTSYYGRKRAPKADWKPISGTLLNPTLSSRDSYIHLRGINHNEMNSRNNLSGTDIFGWRVITRRVSADTLGNSVYTRRLNHARLQSPSTGSTGLINHNTDLFVILEQVIPVEIIGEREVLRFKAPDISTLAFNNVPVTADADGVFEYEVVPNTPVTLSVIIGPRCTLLGLEEV